MKVKTITCHEVYNAGASLQEYALLTFLQHHGFRAEAIHYKPPYLSNHFKFNVVSNPKFNKPLLKQLYLLAKLPGRFLALKKKKNYDLFSKKYIPTGTVPYQNNLDLKNNVPLADAYICGSDQIWNSYFQNGKDPAFYLDFVPKNKLKISYAASFSIKEIEATQKSFVKEKVSRLHHISVRESSGIDILKDLNIENAQHVLDPVFLLKPAFWKEKFIKPIPRKYVFVYDFDSNPQIEKLAKAYAKHHNFKIYTINQNIKYADQNFWLEGPETFLSLIYHSQLNLTNSFHSLAFSILFNKNFYVYNRKEAINTRLTDLIKLINLGDRALEKEVPISQIKPVDYTEVNKIIKSKIKYSKQFLINALKND